MATTEEFKQLKQNSSVGPTALRELRAREKLRAQAAQKNPNRLARKASEKFGDVEAEAERAAIRDAEFIKYMQSGEADRVMSEVEGRATPSTINKKFIGTAGVTLAEDGEGGTYRFPSGGQISYQGGRVGSKSPYNDGVVNAGTDAQARKRLVTNLGLDSEDDLTYDMYGNISNVANRYKQELQNYQDSRQEDVVDEAKRVNDSYLLSNMTPEIAAEISEQADQAEATGQAQAFEQQQAVFEGLIEQQKTQAESKKMLAEAEKISAEATQLGRDDYLDKVGEFITKAAETSNLGSMSKQEKYDATEFFFKMTGGAMITYTDEDGVVHEEMYSPKDIEERAATLGADPEVYRQFLLFKDDGSYPTAILEEADDK